MMLIAKSPFYFPDERGPCYPRPVSLKKINLDVRHFALPAPLVGSIEVHSGFGGTPHSALEIHQIYQKDSTKKRPGYTSEKFLTLGFEKKPYEFVVSGRADGFIESPTPLFEEIKTAFNAEELKEKLIEDKNHPYRWQLRTYGYIYYQQTGIIPDLKFILISTRNFKTVELDIELDTLGYEEWLARRLEELVKETKVKEKIYNKRLETAESMPFPFPHPRPGQMELVQTILESFAETIPLLIEAPTGLGKTAGVLYPSLKESLSRGQKTVFVTPKNSQHQVAEAAVELMQEGGAKIKSVTITSKSKMCLKEEVLCNPEYCEFARDYYTKLAEHDLVNKVAKVKKLTMRKLKALGEEYKVCPFELSLEAIDRSEVVIGDYNYVFSPRSLIGRLTEPMIKPKEKPNLIIDEAHNLPSRAQDYFSPALSLASIKKIELAMAQSLSSEHFLDEGVALTQNLAALIKKYAEGGSRKITIDPRPFLDMAQSVREFVTRYLESDANIRAHDPVLELSNLMSGFVESLELNGDEFFQTYQKTYNDEMLKITCCDASKELALAYKEFKNTAAFSATLKPFSYYQQLMGFNEKTKCVEFSSPFDQDNRKIMVIPQISTKYKDRHQSAPKISEVIERILAVKSGNYIALFPSFEFMKMVEDKINLPGYQVLTQKKEMKINLIKDYLHELREGQTPTLLLGVQGGVFSEGVDYPGDMLIGAFVVGPALPNFDFEREQIKSYYEKRYGSENAFDYAYVFPAMAKAIQSAGRVVRTETDRGIIILIDPRFLEESYYQTMPKEWFQETPRELVSQKILQDIKDFWEKNS